MEIKVVTAQLFEEYMEQYCDLYELCFRQTMKPEEVRWRYLEHHQKDLLACFAIDNGRLAASYSASPVEVRVCGTIRKAILSLNTMTHPDYSGRGLFVRLAEQVYQLAEEKGYQFVFGFPNYISNRTFVSKLGWKDVYEIPTMERMVDEKLLSKMPSDFSAVEEDSGFELDYSSCFAQENDRICVNKSNEYLKWRYADHPINRYRTFVIKDGAQRVCSYVVCKEYKERLNIIDYFMADAAQTELLFGWCVFLAEQLGKTMVTVWAKLGEKEHLHLEKLGFKNNYPITYLAARAFGDPQMELYNYQNWTANMGDDNVY